MKTNPNFLVTRHFHFTPSVWAMLSFLYVILSLFSITAFAANDSDNFRIESIAQMSSDQLAKKLEEAKTSLTDLTGDDANEQTQQKKVTQQRQINLLEEYISQKNTLAQLTDSNTDNTEVKKAEAKLKELYKLPPVTKNTLGSVSLTTLESQLSQTREQKNNLVNQQVQQQKLESEYSTYLQTANTRYQAADQREAMLVKSRTGNQGLAALDLVDKQIENAQLDKLIAKQSETVLEARRQWYRKNEPLIQLKLEAVEIEIDRLEKQLAIYHQFLQDELTVKTQQAEEALQEKIRIAQEAQDPEKRFLAEWAATIAQSQKNISSYMVMNISLTKEITEQRKWLALENEEYISVLNLLSGKNNYDVADRIRRSLEQIKLRRNLLEKQLKDDKFTRINEYHERNFAIADILYGLTTEYDGQKQEVLRVLDEGKKATFLIASQKLLSEYRNILRDEKAALTEAISNGQKLILLMQQRLNKLDEFERLVQSTSFWIKDSRPLNLTTLLKIPDELFKDIVWLQKLISVQNIKQLGEEIRSPRSLLYIIGLLFVLPSVLTILRRYLRGLSVRINDRVQNEGKLVYLASVVLFTGLLSAALLPAYFFVVARLVEIIQLPLDLSVIISTVCDHLALFFLLWFLSRSFFAGRSITEVQFDLPRDAANTLYSGFRWFMLGYLFLIPSAVLHNSPFNNQVLPQIFNILFLVLTTISVYRLIRPQSAFVQHQLKALHVERITASWSLCFRGLLLVAFSTVVMSAIGYQFASQTIIYRLGLTLALLALLPSIYRLLRGSMLRYVELRMSKVIEIDTQASDKSEHKSNAIRLLKFIAIVSGFLLLLRIWGVDEQAVLMLDDIQLYKVQIVGSEPEFVTLGSYMRCLLAIFIVFWAMRSLPNFMNLWIFPHWNTDVGVKYAVRTISRYCLFLVAVFYIISELHLDVAKLGWLMAAIGVGLGFGLQEIVSNFVSGLILLAERPVKPGDVVTIGQLSGTVSHINIRATTIVNFDRQEVMVPNRNLITNEVINWTRSDTINRVVVAIGVAYGSDMDKVTGLLMNIAKEQPKVLLTPPPTVYFMQHGESSLDLELRVFVASPDNILPVRDQLNRQISKVFNEQQIEIPFPQRDLHIRSSDLSEVIMRSDTTGS